MNLRLVGIRPLVGIDWWQSSSAAAPAPREGYETCDYCHKEIHAKYVHFDGESFACPACRKKKTAL
jgi:hypothetical protein